MNRLTVQRGERFGLESLGGMTARIKVLVVGSCSPWLEGVADLLQLAGYEAMLLSDWGLAEHEIQEAAPKLAIVDLSEYVDSLQLPQQLTAMARTGELPILLLNSTGDDRIWHLERISDPRRGRVKLYAHSLLGPTALLDKVKECLASDAVVPVG
jgi:PleD family two-component response regulator